METGNAIGKSWKKEIIIKSILWNTIVEVFLKEKNVNIKKFLISIKISWDNFIVKTNKPIINSEAIIMEKHIKKAFAEKLQKLGLRLKDWFEIKYN